MNFYEVFEAPLLWLILLKTEKKVFLRALNAFYDNLTMTMLDLLKKVFLIFPHSLFNSLPPALK